MSHDLEWNQLAAGAASGTDSRMGLAADPVSTGSRGTGDPGASILLRIGRVQDAVAALNTYRVAIEGGPAIQCNAIAQGNLGIYGPRPVAGYAPGCLVLVAYNPRTRQGSIVGAMPPPGFDPRAGLSDFVHQGGRCGIRVDEAHTARLRSQDGGGVADFSAGRPMDSLPGVEWGAQAETGVRILIDPFLAQLAADETTGVFAYYLDQMLRICGVNFAEHSAGHEREWLLDEGEIAAYWGWTPYPWEQMGVLDPTKEAATAIDPKEWQVTDPAKAGYEPFDAKQRPFHRVMGLGGYLGQGGRMIIQVPPDPKKTPRILAGETTGALGVADEAWTLDGKLFLRAARGIFIEKTLSIPNPTRMLRPEDPAGDSTGHDDPDKDYRFAGRGKTGKDHDVAASLEVTPASDEEGDDPSGQRLAASADIADYAGNFEVQLPLIRHENDWHLPEDGKLSFDKAPEAPITFSDLDGKDHLDPPESIEWKVDDRYGKVHYFPNRSYLRFLDDGGIALGCGFGSELRLQGGKVYITAPGDVVIQSGRTTAVMAGHDAVIRAHNSADVTAANGDLRLKAEINLQALAGNGGEGGILIESRGTNTDDYKDKVGEDVRSAGITLKSATSSRVWGQSVQIRTGVPDADGNITPGNIVIDASKGSGSIIVSARDVTQFVSGSATDVFMDGDNASGVHSRSGGAAVFSGGVYVQGGIAVNGSGSFTGGVSGTFFSGTATHAYSAGTVGQPTQETRDRQSANTKKVQEAVEKVNQQQVSAYGTYKNQSLDDGSWADGGDGSDDVLRDTQVSLRTPEQYKTEDTRLWESRWQQMARLSGQEMPTWTEPPVTAGSRDTMPWPGQERWTDPKSLRLQDLHIHDAETGNAKDRDDDAYVDAALAKPESKTADGNYTVIVRRPESS